MGETLSTVVCVATHPVDLDDGRMLAPGEQAMDVDLTIPHNAGLVSDGKINVIEKKGAQS